MRENMQKIVTKTQITFKYYENVRKYTLTVYTHAKHAQ